MDLEKEFCDLYDENRNLLGKIHNKANTLGSGQFIVVVGIWTFNSKGEILLTKRHPEKKFAPNLWENTGGHVMAGETSVAAVVRELREETGIVVEENEVYFIGTVKVPPFFGDNYYIIRDISITDIVLQEGETSDVKWVTFAEFLKMEATGELAPSVLKYLAPIRGEFEAALKANCY